MSEVFPRLVANQIKWWEKRIQENVWSYTELRNFFDQNKLIKTIPDGLLKYDVYRWEKMPPGRITADVSNIPDAVPGITEESIDLVTFVTKVVLPFTTMDRWKNNPMGIGGGNMMSQVIDQQMKPLYLQVEQLLARGDDMKDTLYKDPFAGQGKFKGLFNGGTTFAAGGGDDVVSAAGDYIASFVTAKKALKTAAFQKQKYMILSDLEPEAGAEQGANLYVTVVPKTERQALMERDDVAGWIASPNFIDKAGTDYKIAVLTPKTNEGNPAFELIQGYNFKVIPLFGGYLSGKGQYETIIIWSGALKFNFTKSVQVSGTLTV